MGSYLVRDESWLVLTKLPQSEEWLARPCGEAIHRLASLVLLAKIALQDFSSAARCSACMGLRALRLVAQLLPKRLTLPPPGCWPGSSKHPICPWPAMPSDLSGEQPSKFRLAVEPFERM